VDQTAGTSFLARRGLGLDLVVGGVVFVLGGVFAAGRMTETFGLGVVVAVWFPEVDFLGVFNAGLATAVLASRASRRSRLLR